MARKDHCQHCGGGAIDLVEHEQNCVMRPDAVLAITCNGHERVYEDGTGYVCRHCGIDMDDQD